MHSFKHYFFKDPVEIRKESNRPIIVNVCVIVLLQNRNNLSTMALPILVTFSVNISNRRDRFCKSSTIFVLDCTRAS